MNKNNRYFLGVIILIFGVVFLLQRLGYIPDTIFFEGWWTLLLIIPAIFSMSKQGVTTGNTVLLVLGVFFLLDARGWNLSGYLVPVLLIALGVGILLKRR
ncbi:MAG: hypothetical protein KJ971_03575 [Firmicutes bacterium]|nr:hypothetical protein [Bacillota bacterium]